MSTHTLIYLGNFDLNFSPTGGWPKTYTAGKDTKSVDSPSDKVDGISFGYMQKDADWFYLVNVASLRLREPVLLIPARHCGGKGFGPIASLIDDDAATSLIVDAIVGNREYRDQLAKHLRGL